MAPRAPPWQGCTAATCSRSPIPPRSRLSIRWSISASTIGPAGRKRRPRVLTSTPIGSVGRISCATSRPARSCAPISPPAFATLRLRRRADAAPATAPGSISTKRWAAEMSAPTALVTGTSTGIGKVIALALARAGYDLAITEIDADHLGDLLAHPDLQGRRAVPIGLDLASQASIEAAFA